MELCARRLYCGGKKKLQRRQKDNRTAEKAEALEEMAVPRRLHYAEEFTRFSDRRQRKIGFHRKRLRRRSPAQPSGRRGRLINREFPLYHAILAAIRVPCLT